MKQWVIYAPKNLEKEALKIMKKEDFQRLFTYIATHNGCMLREIKKELPIKKLEKLLEELIERGIVQRKERRYFVQIKTEVAQDERRKEDLKKSLIKLTKAYTSLELSVGLFQYLYTFAFSPEEVFVVEKGTFVHQQLKKLPVATKQGKKNGRIYFYELHLKSEGLFLSSYFDKLDKKESLNEKEQELYALLQDVNPEYCYHSLGIWLAKCLEKETFQTKREDIFLKALVKLGYLKVRDTEYRRVIPQVNVEEQAAVFHELVQMIGKKPALSEYLLLQGVFEGQVIESFFWVDDKE